MGLRTLSLPEELGGGGLKGAGLVGAGVEGTALKGIRSEGCCARLAPPVYGGGGGFTVFSPGGGGGGFTVFAAGGGL